jgi:hypothetical protein
VIGYNRVRKHVRRRKDRERERVREGECVRERNRETKILLNSNIVMEMMVILAEAKLGFQWG